MHAALLILLQLLLVCAQRGHATDRYEKGELAPVSSTDDSFVVTSVIPGIVIFSGLVLNAVALVVLVRSPSLRRTTTARYLVALTVADSACLTGRPSLSKL